MNPNLGAGQVWAVPLEPRDANSHVSVRNVGGEPLVVQLAVDGGKEDEATVFPQRPDDAVDRILKGEKPADLPMQVLSEVIE